MNMCQASIYKRKAGYVLMWPEEFERESTIHATLQAAKDNYFIELAYDYLGSGIRDNSKAEKISFGKAIEKYGVNDNGDIDYPKTLDQLREENSGFNPEPIDRDHYKIVHKNKNSITIGDKDDTGCLSIYYLTNAKTEREYILQYSGTYGIIVSKRFYREG